MEAVPRLSMICCDLKVSPSNTEFGPILKRYIRDHYHEDPESYSKEIKELETLRQNAVKAPLDFTGCSILKKYYAQLQKLQSRFPMTDDGAACVPFMWTDIYSGVAYNITDIEYEEACILYNIGALHSKLGTMDNRVNAEGIKIACTHFQCAAFAFQHLRDTYPQPKGSDMSHDLLTCFINIMLAQAQECILEKSMLDNRKSSITAKIAAQVVEYYKCAVSVLVSGSPSSDAGSILDIVGSKIHKGWKNFIQFKIYYYASISHLYMGNQAEENEKWGERVAWFQSASDQLAEAYKLAKKLDREELNEALSFTNDVITGKHTSSKKENDFVYHDKVPALSSLPELKGASLVKGIPFSASDPEVSGQDIFARLVPMEAHETSSLYSEEKAKILRSVSAKLESKNEELVAYLSSLQLDITSFEDEERIPQELIEKCAALSVRPTAINDIKSQMNELMEVSKDVEASLKASIILLTEEDKKETIHQETFGKRGPSMIIVDLKKECSKYEEAHKKAVASNNTLKAAVNIHIENLTKLSAPLEEIAESLPSVSSLKTPENVKALEDFSHLVNKVEEMRGQRQFLENQLREALLKDDITKRLVTLDKKDDLQQTFALELKKHDETLIYLDQNLTAQDNILCALTAANAQYADTRQALRELKKKREEIVKTLVSSYDSYDDLMEKIKKGLEFYKKLQSNAARLLSRIKSVTKVQDEERAQRAEAELRKGGRIPQLPPEQQTPKLRDYLPYMNKRGIPAGISSSSFMYPSVQTNALPGQIPISTEPIRPATMGGPASVDPTSFDRSLKPAPTDIVRPDENLKISSMGMRPAAIGSEQTTISAESPTVLSNSGVGHPYAQQQWSSATTSVNDSVFNSQVPGQYPNIQNQCPQPMNPSGYVSQISYSSNSTLPKDQTPNMHQGYNPSVSAPCSYGGQTYNFTSQQKQTSLSNAAVSYSVYAATQQPVYQSPNISGNQLPPSSIVSGSVISAQNTSIPQVSGYAINSSLPANSEMLSPAFHPGSHVPAAYPANSQVPFNSPSSVVSSSFANGSTGGGTSYSSVANSSMSVGNSITPNQSYAGYQPHQGYSDPSTQTVSSLPYNSTDVPNASFQCGAPVQSKQACVIASLDTKTNTLNSLDQYAVANANVNNLYSQNSVYSYIARNSALRTSVGNTNIKQNQISVSSNTVPSQSGYPPSAVTGQSANSTNTMQGQVGYPANIMQGHAGYIPSTISGQINYPSNVVQGQVIYPSAAVQGQLSNISTTVQTGYPANTPQSQTGVISTKVQNQSVVLNTVHEGNSIPGAVQAQVNANYAPQANYGVYPSSNSSMYNASAQNTSMYSHGYYGQSTQFPSNLVYNGNLPTSVPQQTYNTSVPNIIPASNTVSTQYGSNASFPQQINQPASILTDSINVAYGSNSTIPNQQLQPPMEPKPLTPSHSMQSSPIHTSPVNGEINSHITSSDPSVSTSVDNQTRDFITPPPDTLADHEDVPSIPVLQPKVIDLNTLAAMKEKEASHLAKDPLDDTTVCAKFVSEVEKYEKFVDGLLKKSLNGTTPLDQKWKEFTDVQDKESRKRSISVARCCPLKNRFPDVMPYDCNRVKLTSAKDDYINASYLKDICPNCPVFVITQAPMPPTFNDFWLMVWEQQVETLICLLSDTELKNHVYFPKERGQVLTFGAYETSLHSIKTKNGFIERMINVTHVKNRTSRVVVHLQYLEWPVSGLPCSPTTLLQFITDALSYYKQQRNLMRPVVVHCSAGIGRSGCFCLIAAMVSDMNNGHGPRDVSQVLASVSHQRKFLIQDKDQLMFCYNSVLYYAQDVLMRRGILTTRASFEDKLSTSTSSHVRHPSEDFILGGGLAKLQSGIAKLGLSSDGTETKPPESEPEPTEASTIIGNGDTNTDDTVSEIKQNETTNIETGENENLQNRKESVDKLSITSLLDPSNFTLESNSSPTKRKITKENFAASKGTLSASSSDCGDPLNQLDPLWSLKK